MSADTNRVDTSHAAADPAPADLLITGARARLGEGRWASAVAVRDGRIVALGDEGSLRPLAGPQTRVVDAAGGLLVPGFQDAHVHPPFAGRNRLRLWLNDLEGRHAYLDAIAAYADAHPDEPWILGGGWAMEYFPGGTPRKEDLDAIVPDRPVFLFNRDVHGAWVNSKALELAGITDATADPADGRIERDETTGEATGTLHEGAAYRVNDEVVPEPGREEWEAAILDAQGYLHSLGITGWQDAWVTPGTQAAYQSLAADGRLTARVVGALWWDRHRGLEQIEGLVRRRDAALAVNAPRADLGSGFHPNTVKIMTDGVLENHTGALLEPYCDGCGGHGDNLGLSYVPYELLCEAVAAWTGSASRSTCTPSATAQSATPSTRSRPPAPPTARATTGTTSPMCRSSSRRTSSASPSWTSSSTARRTGPSTSRRWTS